ncbi:MAG: carboxymuconolactone decarboxylase family protein, partial [Vicinamibacterales bacterium]
MMLVVRRPARRPSARAQPAAIAATILLLAAPALHAQDRMPRIPPEQLTEEQKRAMEEFRAARNAEVSGPFVPLLRSPEVMNRARAMGDYLRFKSTLPPRLSEFLILVTAREWTQNYEWDAHAKLALQAGVSAETVQAIARGRRPDRLTDDEAILYELSTELQHHKAVSDETYDRAVRRFGEQGVIDAVGITGYYTLLAMVLNTARTPVPAGRTPELA